MKINNRLRKIRKIIITSNNEYALGVMLPHSLNHWLNVSVRVFESGNCIILESGNKPESLSKGDLRNSSIKVESFYL